MWFLDGVVKRLFLFLKEILFKRVMPPWRGSGAALRLWNPGDSLSIPSDTLSSSSDTLSKPSDSRGAGSFRLLVMSLLFVFMGWVYPSNVQAGDPSLKWRTITTKNFKIHYYEKERAVARRVAVLAEDVHKMMAPLMRWKPRRRTHVVLTDDTDSANGLAQVVPRSVVRLYVTPPDDMETLNDYDDWLFLLFVHEYTHILHLATRGGLANIINAIFGLGRGIIYAPNHVQPRWFIEGLAVLNETIRTTGGRIRSSLYNMILRSAVLEKKEHSLAELSSVTIRYPHGRAQYLYGAFFIHYLYKRYGWGALVDISHDYGKQTVPLGLNKIAARHLKGKGYVKLYDEWMKRLFRKFRSELKLVKRRGIIEGRQITKTGESAGYPVFHPDGKRVVFMESDGRSERALKLIPAKGGKKQNLTRVESGGASSFSPDGRFLVFSQLEIHKSVYVYSDLFRWDLKKNRFIRMTKGMRAKEPHISPDGSTVVFSMNNLGRTCLASIPFSRKKWVNLKTRKDAKILWCPKDFEQVYTPSWSPDGRYIVFSGWERGGYRNIVIYDTKNRTRKKITNDRALDTNPRYSSDGKWIYFASDRTGIYNVFAYEVASGTIFQVTNVITGAMKPAVSPDGKTLVYLGFHAEGYDLYTMELDPTKFLTAPPDLPTRPRARRPALKEESRTRADSRLKSGGIDGSETREQNRLSKEDKPEGYDPDPDRVILSDKKYNPLWTMAPETWWFSYEGDSISLLLNGVDIVGYHSWTLTTTYRYESQRFGVGGAYSYSRLWPKLHLSFSYGDLWREDWYVAEEAQQFRAYELGFNVGADFPILKSLRWGFASLSMRYRFSKWDCRECLSPIVTPNEPLPKPPVFGQLGGMSFGLGYSKTRSWTYSVSPEEGRSVGLSLSMYSALFGSDYEALSLSWRWTEYISMPWLEHHVLTLRYSGGKGLGHPRYRSLYSIGGFGQQDMINALIDQTRVVGASLRGYDQSVAYGDQYHLLNMEYRFPIAWLNWAPWTFPLFFRRMWGTAFVDGGHAFFGGWKKDIYKDFRLGVGAELLMDLYVGYYEGVTLRLGYAYGLNEGGGHKYYFFFGIPLS